MSNTEYPFHDVCAGCSCLCDDIRLDVRENRIVSVENACSRGQDWFTAPRAGFDAELDDEAMEQQIQMACQLLGNARLPLVCGLDGLTTQAQKWAVDIGLEYRAAIDVSFSDSHAASVLALQNGGKVTATLGEINKRSELILLWFCDPTTSHPRLLERYGQSAKRIIQVSDQPNPTTELVDEFIRVERESALGFVSRLRLGLTADDTDSSGLGPDRIGELVRQLKTASYGAVFHAGGGTGDACIENLYCLVRELNAFTRFVSLGLAGAGNLPSAENVMSWKTGFPMAVTHDQDGIAYWGRTNSAANLLERNRCDTVLACSTESMDQLSPPALQNLRAGNLIVLAASPDPACEGAQVVIPVSRPGIESGGDWSRLDDVLVPLSSPIQSRFPTAEAVLRRLLATAKAAASSSV